jgi:predicted protein tyrosine phosphatase
MGRIIITRADEVLETLKKENVVAVLSIEHPTAETGGRGAAPRLDCRPQKILSFWDMEQKVPQGPDRTQIEAGVQFILDHLEKGDVLVHCHAGKARSVGIVLGALAVKYPEKDEATLIEELLILRPIAAPNIIVVEMVDQLAERGGKLLQAVLNHPTLTAQRAETEKNRQAALAKRPEIAKKLFPEKFGP